MSSLAQNTLGFNAFCSFNADAAAAAFFVQRGFTSPGFVRNGVGDYTLTLVNGVDMTNQGVVQATVQNNAPGIIGVEVLTTTTLRVRTFSATTVPAIAAADLDFWLQVFETGPS